MDTLFMEDDVLYKKTTCMLLKRRGFELVAPDFTGADEGMEKFIEAIGERGFDVLLLDLNWDGAYNKDGLRAAQYIRQAFADDEEARPRLVLWSGNAASLEGEEAAVFDRILTRKGMPEAADEIQAALQEIEAGWLQRRDPAIGRRGAPAMTGPTG